MKKDKATDAYDAGDYETALKEFRKLAEKGDAQAQFNLGVMYSIGKGVTQDCKEAVKWYRLAAEQGLRQAQEYLGVMYKNGLYVIQDDKEATKWFRLAAQQRDDELQPWDDAVNKRVKDFNKKVVDYAFQNLKLFGLVQPHEMETIELDGNIVKAPTKIFYSMNFNVDLSVSSFSPEEYKEKMWLHIFNSLEPPPCLAQSFYVIEIYPKDDSRRAFFQCVPLGDEQSLHGKWENGQRVIHALLIAERILRFITMLSTHVPLRDESFNKDELFNLAFTKCINYYNKELAGKPIRNVSRNTSDKSKHIYDSFGKKENDSDEKIYYPPDIFNESN